MSIQSFNGISDDTLNAPRSTSDGKSFTLNYSEKTTLSTDFKGQGKANANAQGWERNSHKFFGQLEKEHPEMFSKSNSRRIANHQNPIVDQRMIDHNPQFKDYKGQTLVHHHIGGDGEATVLPSGMHKGSGDVHIAEKEAGITERCKNFSNECQKILENNPNMKNTSVESMRAELVKGQKIGEAQTNDQQSKNVQQLKTSDIKKTTHQEKPGQQGPVKSAPAQTSPSDRSRDAASRGAAISKDSKTSTPNTLDAQSRGDVISRGHSSNTGGSQSAQSRGTTISEGGHGGDAESGQGASIRQSASGGGSGEASSSRANSSGSSSSQGR